jgi:hypothetical protein
MSSKNNLALQNELENITKDSSVTEGRLVENNLTYPAVSKPLVTKKNNEGHFNIVDEAGHVVGSITSTIFGLAENTVNMVKDVGSGIINTTGNIITATTDGVEKISNKIIDTGSNLVSATSNTVNNMSNMSHKIVNNVSSNVNDVVHSGSNLVKSSTNTIGDVSKSIVSGTKNGINSSVNSIRDAILNTESNPSLTVEHASNKVHEVLSNKSPSPEDVKLSTIILNNSIHNLDNSVTPQVRESASNVSVLLENPNVSNEDIQRANVSLRESIISSNQEMVNKSRKSLRESVKMLNDEVSKIHPNESVVKSISQVLSSHIENELQNNNTPNDEVKEESKKVIEVLQNPSADNESIKHVTVSLHNKLESQHPSSLIENIGSTVSNVVGSVVHGVGNTVNAIVNTVTGNSHKDNVVTETETGNNIIKSLNETKKNTVSNIKSSKSKRCRSKQFGGDLKNGISILNINDNSDANTRMLIPNNFLDSKHLYFINYHSNGTNVYDYKFSMKGGKVDNLELRNINSIWNNNQLVEPLSNNTISNGTNVINNIINKLSDSPQVGGYVRERIADKDEFYNEYKNYKLKYLSLKN